MSALEPVAYEDGEVALTGWLARPAGQPRGAALVLPTIVGMNPPIERRARMLADAGYLAMIADYYGEPVTDFAAAGALAKALRESARHFRARLRASVSALSGQPHAAGLPMAAIGYCMGGQAALELARDSADLVAAVSFHGLLETLQPAEPGAIKPRLLICHGDADPMVPRTQVLSFWEEMDRAGADWHFHSYAGVKHGFTDPGSDARGLPTIAYNASADRQSWAAMSTLLDVVFG